MSLLLLFPSSGGTQWTAVSCPVPAFTAVSCLSTRATWNFWANFTWLQITATAST